MRRLNSVLQRQAWQGLPSSQQPPIAQLGAPSGVHSLAASSLAARARSACSRRAQSLTCRHQPRSAQHPMAPWLNWLVVLHHPAQQQLTQGGPVQASWRWARRQSSCSAAGRSWGAPTQGPTPSPARSPARAATAGRALTRTLGAPQHAQLPRQGRPICCSSCTLGDCQTGAAASSFPPSSPSTAPMMPPT